jgi:hypothetical protein
MSAAEPLGCQSILQTSLVTSQKAVVSQNFESENYVSFNPKTL